MRAGFSLGVLVGAVALLAAGCGSTGNDAKVLSIDEIHGSIKVAEDAQTDLRFADAVTGIQMLTRGGLIEVPEGSRVVLKYLGRRGLVVLYGPAALEVGDVRLIRGGGIHAKPKEVHATLLLRHGLLAGAMEGPMEDRPSIEVATDRLSGRMDPLGKWMVMVARDDEASEAWVRDERGIHESNLLSRDGKAFGFAPNAVALVTNEDPLGEDSVEVADKNFSRGFLDRLVLEPFEPPSLDHMLDELSWRSLK